MCWNPEISLSTFVFAVAGIIIGYVNHQHNMAWNIFYMSFASMQLIEYFIWKNLGKKDVNTVLSVIAFLLILSQPIAAGLLIENKTYQMWYYALYVLWTLSYIMLSRPIVFKTEKATNGHLSWLWLSPGHGALIVTWVAFLVAAIWMSSSSTLTKALITVGFLAITYISWWFYHKQEHTWGSMYCSFANIVFVLVIAKSFWSQYCRA